MRFCTLLGAVLCGDIYHPEFKSQRNSAANKAWDPAEETSEYWNAIGREQIKRAKAKRKIEGKAKNVILFIGDGMGVQVNAKTPQPNFQFNFLKSTTAGRILIDGEAHVTNMDNMDFTGLIKTYNVDYQTPGADY